MSDSKINLFFSHSVERLAQMLSNQVKVQQRQEGLLKAPKVLVPNANMQRFLQLAMAKSNGVCAHVDFPFLETGLFQVVTQLLGKQYEHLNGAKVAWSIWRLLLDDSIVNEPIYKPIQSYLNAAVSTKLQAAKRWQLSQKLAKLMLDYESQRPEMVQQWLRGHVVFQNSKNLHLTQLEQLQRDLYVRLFKVDGSQSAITLYQASLLLSNSKLNMSQQSIHIFTPSRLSQLHRRLLVQLGQSMTVHVYALNVCSEYWEDLQTEDEERWQRHILRQYKKHPVTLFDNEGVALEASADAEVFAELSAFSDENDLLKAWGKPGREALKLFSDIETDAIHQSIEYQDDWLIPDLSCTDSLLHKVQATVLTRSNQFQQVKELGLLNSVQFACAPSVIREVESVYNSILWNLQQNPDLALNEIAVLVTDMSTYRFVLEQVFETLNHQHGKQLAYAIVDSTAAKESRYAEAVVDLFSVLEDDFIRATVFKWLDNPCVQAANQFTESDWQDWLLVVDELGIYCGYSSLYHVIEDETGVDKLFTWEQGLTRLHLSLATVFHETDNLDVSSIGAESIGKLSVLLETLYQYKLRFNQQLTTTQWEQQLNHFFDLLFAVPAEDSKEQSIQMALQQSLLQLAETQPEMLLSFDDIKQFIQHELKQLPASKGSYLSGGVVCAALQPMRPIPFKLTYVLGMDEKSFPGQFRHETLDLTQRSRRIGDINTIENNNYLLLETLMCTREKLYLSYVGIDLLKDDVIEPSPSWMTLYRYCNTLIDFDGMEMNQLPIYTIPLDASESIHYDGSQLDLHDWGVNFSYSDYLFWVNKHVPNWEPNINQLSAAQLRAWHKIQAVKTIEQQSSNFNISLQHKYSNQAVTSELSELIQIDTKELADYLTNPQAAILKQLGVNNKHPEDRSLLEHEPLELTSLLKHDIFTTTIKLWLQQPNTADLKHIISQTHQAHLFRSKAPLALFAELDDLIQVEEQLQKTLRSELQDKQLVGVMKMGQSVTQMSPNLVADGPVIKLDAVRHVQINGIAEQLYQKGGYLTDQVVISSSKQNDKWNKKLLQPFLNWCMWQLSDEIKVAEEFNVHMVFPDKLHTVVLKPWYSSTESFATRSTIEQYIKQLLLNFLEKPAQFLPSELLTKLKIATKGDTNQVVPFLKKNSQSKTIHYLAYDDIDLTKEDKLCIAETYDKALQWPSYEEILKVVDIQASDDPVMNYRQNLLPLFAMVFGTFETQVKGGHS